MAQNISIKYTDKDFNSLRQQLIEMSKNYFPDSYNDFSATSPGMMFMEMSAYVGDILSFYQDSQLQETYLQYAQNPSNLYTLAYMMGYRPRATRASSVEIEVSQRVAASGASYTPDWDQALSVNGNVQLEYGKQKFIINQPVDFKFSSSYDPTDVTIFSLMGDNPSEFILTKKVTASAGEIATKTVEVIGHQQNFTFEIDDINIIGVLDIVDSNGDKWYEVPYLGQETVYETTNITGSEDQLTLINVPRRFVTRLRSNNQMQVQFGSGAPTTENTAVVPNPTNIGSPFTGGISRLDYAYDPSNFLYTDSYGIAPSSTVLTVRYLRGGGVASNVEANTLTTSTNATFTAIDNTYSGTLTYNNPKPATGGKDGDSAEEVRQNSLKAFAEQGRLVTKQDYAFRALTMTPNLGAIAKSFVTTPDIVTTSNAKSYDRIDSTNVCLYVLAYDKDYKLTQGSTQLKKNLKKYLAPYMMLTDSLDIKDAYIINIGINYDIISLPNYNSREVLFNCSLALKNYFRTSNRLINQPINLSTVYTLLDRIKGVQTVQNIKITTKTGGSYSEYDYDIPGAMKDNIIFPSLDPMIFELKYPDNDIQGRITTL